jgi:hypothetical protein
MQISQQIVGVNQRLGNTAVPNMQGTTRVLFDSADLAASADQTLQFFSGVSTRLYPLTNLNNNRFEVGESLAITNIFYGFRATNDNSNGATFAPNPISTTADIRFSFSMLLNLYVGNQRIIKDLELVFPAKIQLGESVTANTTGSVVRLETPIVIPPQIEFYATVRLMTQTALAATDRLVFGIGGQGTLLNTKSNF